MPSFDFKLYSNTSQAYVNSPDKGLSFCDKKLKKDPSNLVYQLARIGFLEKLRRLEDSLKALEELRIPQDLQSDTDFLEEIQNIYLQCHIGLGTFKYACGPKLLAQWKSAFEKIPLNRREAFARQELLGIAWNNQCWDLAQTIFNQLQRDFKDKPDYHFAWIASTYLYASALSSKDTQLAGNLKRLAIMSLSKIVDNTVKRVGTPRKITSPRQFRLAYELLAAEGKWDELYQYLSDSDIPKPPGMGPEATRALLRTLEEQGKRKELYDLTYAKLSGYRDSLAEENKENMGETNGFNRSKKRDSDGNIKIDTSANDWQLWQSLINSQTDKPTSDESQTNIRELLRDILRSEPDERAANRSLLIWSDKYARTELIDALITSFSLYSSTRPCFDDLKAFMENLSHRDEAKFLAHIDSEAQQHYPFEDEKQHQDSTKAKNWVMVNVNALKFEYYLCISKAPLPTKESLENFVSDSLRMYKISLGISKDCGDEACILAVMALVKLHHFSRDHELDDDDPANRSPGGTPRKKIPSQCYLVQAICLLQFLRHNSPHNYSASLLSGLISQMLNLTSLAATALTPLNIKEIQHDTVGHLFWSRISITHPFDSSPTIQHLRRTPSQYVKPNKSLNIAHEWFASASANTTKSVTIDDTPFDKFMEFNTFQQSIDRSFSSRMYLLELRRLEFMRENSNVLRQRSSIPIDFLDSIQDNRDFKTIPSFEYSKTESFDNFVTTKPKPMEYWLARHTLNDLTTTLLAHKAPIDSSISAQLSSLTSYLNTNASEITYQLTSAEQAISPAWDILCRLSTFLILGSGSPNASSSLKTDISLLSAHISSSAFSKPPTHDLLPSTDVIQDIFLRFELLKTISLLTTLCLSKSKPTIHASSLAALSSLTDSLTKLKTTLSQVFTALHEQASSWRSEVKSQGKRYVNDLLGAGVMGDDVADLVIDDHDGDGIGVVVAWNREGWLGDVVDSAVDALDGVCKVTL